MRVNGKPIARNLGAANRDLRQNPEPKLAMVGGFLDFIILLLVLRSFFLPLFIIPTGSMAETLCGEYARHVCPNCGNDYQAGFHTPQGPSLVQCPNCRWIQETAANKPLRAELHSRSGDRIAVHGWTYDIGGFFGPQRWDVVVFKNPNNPDENYIKRLLGLPGETLEIIDGDLFVTPKGSNDARVARKSPTAQTALWFPYYDQDYLPAKPAPAYAAGRPIPYQPRWVGNADAKAWKGLNQRTIVFDGSGAAREEIRFVTGAPDQPPLIDDMYGYNGAVPPEFCSRVTDVRVGADVSVGAGAGAVEMSVTKDDARFIGSFFADGRVVLERSARDGSQREAWSETKLVAPLRAARLAIGHADYQITLEVDDRVVLVSPPEKYTVSGEEARRRSVPNRAPAEVFIAANDLRAAFSHIRVDRDIHYTQARTPSGQPGHATMGHPLTLRDDAYFVCGDNSPNSLDGRCWEAGMLGGHLREKYEHGEYDLGTVPANQMLGRAFLVYWPGFMQLLPNGKGIVPDAGRVRWIH